MNTLQSTREPSLEKEPIYKENPQLEKLWTDVFGDEYKPEIAINFAKIKDILATHTYPDQDLCELCEFMLSLDTLKKNSVSVLELLNHKQKETLVDLLLKKPLAYLKEKYGLAMVFWLWHYSSEYNDKIKLALKDFWIHSTEFV